MHNSVLGQNVDVSVASNRLSKCLCIRIFTVMFNASGRAKYKRFWISNTKLCDNFVTIYCLLLRNFLMQTQNYTRKGKNFTYP